MIYCPDVRGVDIGQSLSLLMEVQDMVVEPFSFNEDHVKFFVLSFVQFSLIDLEFIRFDNLVLSTNTCGIPSCSNLVLFVFGTDQSIVDILHHILFTQNYTKTLL